MKENKYRRIVEDVETLIEEALHARSDYLKDDAKADTSKLDKGVEALREYRAEMLKRAEESEKKNIHRIRVEIDGVLYLTDTSDEELIAGFRQLAKRMEMSEDVTDVQRIRAWAKRNGRIIGDRGRIPTSIRAEYEAATRNDESEMQNAA